MKSIITVMSFSLLMYALPAFSQAKSFDRFIQQESPALNALYKKLHAHPELSFHEKETSNTIAKQLQSIGFEVVQNVGGYGVVGLLKNGQGPTVLIRTDMDALPVLEQTTRPYKSTVTSVNKKGQKTPVMHACGHDMHMSVFVGTAKRLAQLKDSWHGTLLMIAQPAEELISGAQAMLDDGLFTRFPRPDYNLALHVSADLPAGQLGIREKYVFANVDTVKVTIKGIGGHGAYPHTTIDPVVLAAKFVLSLQTIVSRNIDPFNSAVITVGSIQGGLKSNVIPDKVEVFLSVRSYEKAVRNKLLSSIKHMAKGLAIAESLPERLYPKVEITESAPAVYNDPKLIEALTPVLEKSLSKNNVVHVQAVMASEDFGLYSAVNPNIPSAILWLGSVNPLDYQRSLKNEIKLPSLHSAKFDPNNPGTMSTGIKALSVSALQLFQQGKAK